MSCDLPCMSYMALYIISMHIIHSNSRTSTHHWKLNLDEGKVMAAAGSEEGSGTGTGLFDVPEDPLLSLLTNKVTNNGEWRLEAESTCKDDCRRNVNSG